MRLWSIHPRYLDARGLVTLWREGLLAKKVLEGHTKGYKKHPQLMRFRSYRELVALMNAYLYQVYLEAEKRGYKFDISKIEPVILFGETPVTRGQLRFEFSLLIKKVEIRDKRKFEELKRESTDRIEPNPVFRVVDGDMEPWEKYRRNYYEV